jgi:hypothetical protein
MEVQVFEQRFVTLGLVDENPICEHRKPTSAASAK